MEKSFDELFEESTRSNRVRIDWWLNPKPIAKELRFKGKLVDEDWLVIKKMPFGEIGYDYEEGLKIETTTEQLSEAIVFLKAFHNEREIPFVIEGEEIIVADCCSSNAQSKLDKAAKEIGLVASQKWSGSWVVEASNKKRKIWVIQK